MMCRRCGESDKRGNTKNRRRSRARLLTEYGNGVICPCIWCGVLLWAKRTEGYLAVGGKRLRIVPIERDRLMEGEGYAHWNLVPSCGPCNRRRTYERMDVPEGCWFGRARLAVAS